MATDPARQGPLVLVHGCWHGSWCWSEVTKRLAAADRPVAAIDLAGHGLHARRPGCLSGRPYALEALATELSPVAGIGLDEAAELLIDDLERIGNGRRVTVVAHSMAGAVLTRAAQQAPELVARLVYLAAVMPASAVSATDCHLYPENDGALVAACLRADPAAIGALRIDPASGNREYHELLRRTFYDDVDSEVAAAARSLLTPDGPVGLTLGSTTLTADGWGSLPRTYVVCTQDMAIRPALQRRMIAQADDAFPANPTSVVELTSSHSPFLSMPEQLADVLARLS